ncbi:enolase-phosphatase E1-like isoform X2 [Dysidea avara]|uniref:enolase-phosphatase E1-like isoform X2 n=1 Tax=Dysidea avara TaxID=196820 RepID=UPI0033182CFD
MEQSTSEGNSKEGATIVSAEKDYNSKKGILKRNKKANKLKSSSKNDVVTNGPVSAFDVGLSPHKLQQRTTNTNNNHTSTVAAPVQKTENLHEVKEKETTSSKPPEKPKDKSASATVAATSDASADTLNKVKSSLENMEQSSLSFLAQSDKITSPVSVTPEPPMKRPTVAKDKVSTPKKSHSSSGATANPWPKFSREIQRCLNSLDRLNDELNMNCDYASSEISDLFGEMQMTLQNREQYLLLELESLRNTASSLLAERWDVGMQLKKKVAGLNPTSSEHCPELQQEIQQFISDRKLDKDIANKCRFVADHKEGLQYAKNFGHVESNLPTYTSLIMANSKVKFTDPVLEETPVSVMDITPVETGYGTLGWMNKEQILPLESFSPSMLDPLNDLQIISLDQLVFITQQPQPIVSAAPVIMDTVSPTLETLEQTEIAPLTVFQAVSPDMLVQPQVLSETDKLSAEELLVIQNRVRESLLKQGVKLYPPDGMEGDLRGGGKLTSAQREKKRQKRHRYRERKRLERKAERMEKASESSNSVDTNETSQQTDSKIPFRHKKLCKKDKLKPKVASENEESKLKEVEPHDTSLPQCNGVNSTKLQTNSEEMSSSSSSNATEELRKSRVCTASYAENTTSGDDPSSADDVNMFPTSESVADTDTQHQTKESQVTKTVKADLLPSTSSSGITTATKTHTDA